MPNQALIVKGQISQHDGNPFANVIVRAVDKDLRSEQLLGETTTNDRGFYEISYTAEQFRRAEKKSADLIIRVFSSDGVQRGESQIFFNAAAETTINLVIRPPVQREWSEYERLVLILMPVLDGVEPADLTDEDLTFLVGETGIEQQRLEMLRQAARLARATNLPTEVFYGLGRQNLPLNLDALLREELAVLQRALVASIDRKIIPEKLREQLDQILRQLLELSVERGIRDRRTHEIVGRLLNQATDAPLTGLTVRAFDLDAGSEPNSLGFQIANDRGLFTFTLTTIRLASAPEDEAVQRRLRFHILDRDRQEIHQTEIQVVLDADEIIEIQVPVPPVEEPTSPSVVTLTTELQLELPSELRDYLTEKGILTLEDIRKNGGIQRLTGLPVNPDHPTVKTLEAHANLYTLSTDLQVNRAIIDKGFLGVSAIANAPRTEFVKAIQESVGDFKAARLHAEASAGMRWLNNVTTSLNAYFANGVKPNSPTGNWWEALEELLSNFKCGCQDCEAAVSPLAYLADLLDYSITHLKNQGQAISLSWLKTNFHQPFGDLPASCKAADEPVRQVRLCVEVLRSYIKVLDPPKPTLEKAEKSYRLAAYTSLLNQIGTSYPEIRVAHHADDQTRQVLADRLSIAVEHLDALLLDPNTMTEADLETLFGLVDTRDPWAVLQDDVTPLLQTWRIQYLHALWKTQDWILDPFTTGELPTIDPNIISSEDMRNPVPGQAAFDLWQARRSWVETTLANFKTEREANGLEHILKQVLGNPLLDLDALLTLLTQGNDYESAEQQIESLSLTVESFTQLMAIRAKDKEGKPIEETEWQEVYAILTQAQKLKKFSDWLTEEKAQGIILDPKQFWVALEEPALPKWLAAATVRQTWEESLRRWSEPPLIDPDLIGLVDLKDPTAGNSAYELWKNRRTWINSRLASLKSDCEVAATLLDGFNTIVQSAIGASLEELLALNEQYQQGNDITARLEQLSLSLNAFSYLLRIHNSIASETAVLESEWDEVYSILTQVQKHRTFAEWRRSEQAQAIVVSPEHFSIPEPDPTEFPPPQPTPLPTWRAKLQVYQDWQDKLQARIDQEQAVINGLKEATSATEADTLPILRDALVMASNAEGKTLTAKTKAIAKRLLIDTQNNGCQMTTRASQAIETLQALLSAVRTDELQNTFPNLELDADDFDEEWQWIGSYSTWRSAMLVFLYPENILQPSLRKWQTPAFSNLVNTLRNSRTLTPEDACQAAKVYSDYFRDVCNLNVEASCQARTRVYRGEKCSERSAAEYRSLFYTFARAGATGTVYWSAYDSNDDSGYAQTFWRTVPGLEGSNTLNIIGAVLYEKSEDQRFILLFVRTSSEETQKLILARYNLEQQGWMGEAVELELPKDIGEFSAAIGSPSESSPPRLIFRYGYQRIFTRRIGRDGSNWEEGDFDVVNLDFDFSILRDLAWNGGTGFGLLGQSPTGQLFYAAYERSDKPKDGVWHWNLMVFDNKKVLIELGESFEENKEWVGILWWWQSGEVPKNWLYLFWRLNGVTYKQQFITEEIISPPEANQGDLRRIAYDAGSPDSGTPRLFAYQVSEGNVFCMLVRNQGDDLVSLSPPTRIAPQCSGPFDIPERIPETKRWWRRTLIEKAFKQNLNGLSSNLTYIGEAYYFVPIQIALELQKRGEYEAALNWFRTVYDYTMPKDQRKIYYGLKQEEAPLVVYETRAEDWLLDPLNPHAIASTRANAYTRFTLVSLILCLLDFADAEFTLDTAESLPRARRLYETALELFELPELSQRFGECEELVSTFDIKVGDSQLVNFGQRLKTQLTQIKNPKTLAIVINDVKRILAEEGSSEARFARAQSRIVSAIAELPPPPAIAAVVDGKSGRLNTTHTALLADPQVFEGFRKAGRTAGKDFLDTVSLTTGIATTRLESDRVELPWLRLRSTPPTTTNGAISADSADSRLSRRNSRDERLLTRFNPVAPSHVATLAQLGSIAPFQAVKLTRRINNRYIPSPTFEFCIPLNPILKGLRLRTEVKLFYLRTCRNFAGMKRQVEPYAAPTDAESGLPTIGAGGQLVLPGTVTLQPTPYRYSFLIERAKELVQLAAQIESGMLSALEKRDAEYYNLLRARQDVQMSRARVQLQELRVQQAEQEVGLAELQQQGAQLRVDQYQALIDAGPNQWEQKMVSAYLGIASAQTELAMLDMQAQIVNAMITVASADVTKMGPIAILATASSILSGVRYQVASTAIEAEKDVQIASLNASLERRWQEWELQKSFAEHDVVIGTQQIRIARNQVRAAGQEHNIAKLETDYANETLEFLRNKFTNVELYDWMSSVLEGVYSYFLQQATAVAKLAENQLAFERQEVPPAYIQADYWVLTEGGVGGTLSGAASGRRGLTGSARLLQDIYKLNQYALDTNQRKLQLTQTFSLAQLFPFELQQLRQTGVITFETPMELFDRKFPGHYLRLIKQVRTSVIALIPPAEGIYATLSTRGLSRVAIGGNNGFQKVNIQRPPESVALTSPINATGLFELNPDPELLLPFEGIGVDTVWEFRMPKAANLFDYRTIADVLITIEYTALNSYDYRQQVILTLNNKISADRSFSFRNQFADAWYDLHNPEQTNTPMVIRFKTGRSDFPPNVEDLKIQQLLLYFARSNGNSFEVPVTHLHFTEQDGIGTVGGGATSIDGLTSTRKGNASSWTSILGKTPIGEWELALPNTEEMKNRFKDEEVEDILFVITYFGRTPEWSI